MNILNYCNANFGFAAVGTDGVHHIATRVEKSRLTGCLCLACLCLSSVQEDRKTWLIFITVSQSICYNEHLTLWKRYNGYQQDLSKLWGHFFVLKRQEPPHFEKSLWEVWVWLPLNQEPKAPRSANYSPQGRPGGSPAGKHLLLLKVWFFLLSILSLHF